VFAKTSRWIAYPLAWLLLMVAPMLIDAWAASAGPVSEVNQFTIPSFKAHYQARRSDQGLALDVTETITASFPRRNTNRGIERRLDTRYGGTDIELSGFQVTDPSGKRIPFTQRTESDGDIVLRIGRANSYVFGRVDYVVRYTIGQAMVQADDRQEIYLDVNGTGWQQPFGRVQATVDIPSDLAGNLLGEQACYRGAAGSTRTCPIVRSGDTFVAEALALEPRETMTIAIGFAQGTVVKTVPAPVTTLGWWGVAAMPLLAAGFLGLALLVRRRRTRSLLLRDDVEIQYLAPDVQPILAADFLGRPERGAAAQLAQLVLDGHARVSSQEAPIGTAPQQRARLSRGERAAVRADLRVQLVDRKGIDDSVASICAALFGRGKSIPLGSVPNRDIAEASAERQELLADSGLRGQSRLGAVLFWLGYLMLILYGWFQLALGIPGLLLPFLGLGTIAVLLLVAGVHYYPRVGRLTEAGHRLRDHLAGLHRFVTMAEADRIAWMQNAVDAPRISGADDGSLIDLYEPLLPYAIVFGVEDTWRQAMGNLYELVPRQRERTVDASAVNLALSWVEASSDHYTRSSWTESYWDSRPSWGEGWVSGVGRGVSELFDSWATSRDDDRGGSWGSGSSSSWSSSGSSSSGSSGGGSSGGGVGGGGGGGW